MGFGSHFRINLYRKYYIQLPTWIHAYISMGWPLFPCSSHNKKPLTQHGFKDATLDISQLEAWYTAFPDCAWGTPTSSSRAVIDIDPKHGGDVEWAKLIALHGALPECPCTETGSKGLHFWVELTEGSRSTQNVIAQGIDTRGGSGLTVGSGYSGGSSTRGLRRGSP